MIIPEIFVIIVMLLINAVFAAYELALASLSIGRVKHLAEQNVKGATSALFMKSKQEASLAVVQIGVTIVGAITAATGGAEAEELLMPYIVEIFHFSRGLSKVIAIGSVVLPLSALTITIGELVPKTLALKNNEKICLMLSPAMRVFSFFVYPLVIVFEFATKLIVRLFEKRMKSFSQAELGVVELRAQARALRTERIIDSEQERMIIGASNLSRIKVKDIVIPSKDMVTLYADGSLAAHFVTLHLEAYTRFPVAEKQGDPQTIIGYVNIKELLFLAKSRPENPSLREIVRPMLTFLPDTSIGEAFSHMMKEHVHLALIKGQDGKVVGMITLEDILEEVIGDVQDEFDRLPRHITSSGKQYIVGGGVLMSVLSIKIGKPELIKLAGPDTTFSEWIKKNSKKKIANGDTLNINGYSVIIRKIRRNHVFEAMLSLP
jgi:putative hemolysin